MWNQTAFRSMLPLKVQEEFLQTSLKRYAHLNRRKWQQPSWAEVIKGEDVTVNVGGFVLWNHKESHHLLGPSTCSRSGGLECGLETGLQIPAQLKGVNGHSIIHEQLMTVILPLKIDKQMCAFKIVLLFSFHDTQVHLTSTIKQATLTKNKRPSVG